MSAEDFFSRWSRRKREAAQDAEQVAPAGQGAAAPAAATAPEPPPELPPPTMEDVEALDGDSDFARFMRRDVDETVKRGAMKKLFADPHFNVMDGLDIYIDDYNKFEPLPAAVVALLEHAKPIFNPPTNLARSAMAMLDAGSVEGGTAQGDQQPQQPGAQEGPMAPDSPGGAAQPEAAQPTAGIPDGAQAAGEASAPASAQDEPMQDPKQDPKHTTAQAADQSLAAPEDGNPIQSL